MTPALTMPPQGRLPYVGQRVAMLQDRRRGGRVIALRSINDFGWPRELDVAFDDGATERRLLCELERLP